MKNFLEKMRNKVDQKKQRNFNIAFVGKMEGNIYQDCVFTPSGTFFSMSEPSLCECYIGREEEVDKIHKILGENNVNCYLIYSVGGLGKTETVIRYAKKYKTDYNNIGYFEWPDNKTLFTDYVDEFVKCVNPELLKIPDVKERYQGALAHLAKFEKQKNLLIIDNIPEDISFEVWQDVITGLDKIGSHVLLCAREAYSLVYSEELRPLKDEDCKKIFEYYWEKEITESQLDIWNEVLNLSGKHTLILEIMAKTMNYTGMDLESFYCKLQEKGFNTSKLKITPSYFKKGKNITLGDHIFMLFDMQKVKSECEENEIKNLCLFPAKQINIDDWCRWRNMTREDIFNVMEVLFKRGWIKRKSETIWIHPLVADAAYRNYDVTWEDCKQLAVSIYNDMAVDFQMGENVLYKRKWLPFMVTVLEKFQHKHDNEYNYAEICMRVGKYYFRLREDDNAIKWHRVALDIFESLKQVETIEDERVEIENDLADIYNDIAKDFRRNYGETGVEKAKFYHRKALKLHIEKWNWRGMAVNYNNLGLAFIENRNADRENRINFLKAYYLFKRAKDINSKKLDKNKNSLGYNYNNLGVSLVGLGEYEKAVMYYQEALRIRKKVLSNEDPEIARTMINMAKVYSKLGNEKAEEYYLEGVRIQENFFGRKNLNTLETYSEIVDYYIGIQNYNVAYKFLDKYLQNIQENKFLNTEAQKKCQEDFRKKVYKIIIGYLKNMEIQDESFD